VIVEREEAEAQFMATATRAIAEDAERDLAEALPALDAAVACLSKLKKVWRQPTAVRIQPAYTPLQQSYLVWWNNGQSSP
jgi:hypothetical protein